MSLYRKVFLVTAVLIAVVFATALALVDRQVRAATVEAAAAHLASTVLAEQEKAKERIAGRHQHSDSLAAHPAIIEAFARGDRTAVQAALEALADEQPMLEVFVALGNDGSLLAFRSPGQDRLPASLATVEPFASFADGKGRGLWLLGSGLYEMVAVPVSSQDDRTLGVLGLGLPIGQRAIERFHDFTQTDMLVVADGRLLASSLPEGISRALTAGLGKLESETPGQLTAGGFSYLARQQVFPLDLGGDHYAQVMLRSLASADRLSAQILRGLLLVGLGAGILSFGCAWIGARRITRPLSSLAGAMGEMARTGTLKTDFQTVSGDPEVKRIEAAFRQLLVSLEESRRARERSYVEAVGAVVTAADARDHETTGHSFRVAHYAVSLARAMGIRGETLKSIEWGSLLHDVGKMVVPDEILRKMGPLTESEWHIMRQHPNWGFDMLAEVGFLQQVALEIVYSHHERWDGAGYPRGLAGEEIPLAARIFAVVDTYDAITSDRPYRKAHSHQAAMAELLRVAGAQLDLKVVEAFYKIPEVELRRLRELCKRIHPGLSLPPDLLDAMTEPETGELAALEDERLAL